MSVTYPRGFRAGAATAGKPSGLPDFGLMVGDPGTTAAGLFTTNRVAAAPVVLARPPAHFSKDGLAARARAQMAGPESEIRVALGTGPGQSRVLGCDLSYDYVKINGEYTT